MDPTTETSKREPGAGPLIRRVDGGVEIRAWVRGVPVESDAYRQLENLARLPIVHGHVVAMPDVHVGIGATIGTVFASQVAVVPAAVGVDIGCGMMALRTSLAARDLPDDLRSIRRAIEQAVPHGRTDNGRRGDRGSWGSPPPPAAEAFATLEPRLKNIVQKHPGARHRDPVRQLGTLGTGNHFIELCRDDEEQLWVLLHSGSRGIGNRIGTYFIERARQRLHQDLGNLPDKDLAWLDHGSRDFVDYVEAVEWAQEYARTNRELMMAAVIGAMRTCALPAFRADLMAVQCHHNYVARERHAGVDLLVTRKGAVRAGKGELGIIPGSMGARSFIVRGRGNPESFQSCSHGAGRRMSRTAAKKQFTIADHEAATRDVECRKDAQVIDETPMAYKDIDAVMAAQADLVEIVHTLKQVICVKG
ncbi:MAG: RtcB family protein [Planctomycetes bacterium]|nr:RtcB family protein [Planctomycetota bacterium]